MKTCPKCNNMHEKRGTFCSRKCANSREWSDSDKHNKSVAAKKAISEGRINHSELCLSASNESARIKRSCTWNKKLLSSEFDSLTWESMRKRVILEQDCKCSKCGYSEWMECKISFEIDHIDGDNQNNSRENLEALCPNCHSLTPTWRGRNKGRRISDEELIDAIKSEKNIRQALLVLGLAAKGANYARASRLKDRLVS